MQVCLVATSHLTHIVQPSEVHVVEGADLTINCQTNRVYASYDASKLYNCAGGSFSPAPFEDCTGISQLYLFRIQRNYLHI